MSTEYQNLVNDMTGALGPKTSAFWKPHNTPAPWALSSQPLYYDTVTGLYTTAFDKYGSQLPLQESFGARRKKKGKRRVKKKVHFWSPFLISRKSRTKKLKRRQTPYRR